ncbi:MAG: SUMF1/EgtB/PvdO family nonheme iron enzyme [Polyangiaceae bacterium]|nr:SUMF1/EgtB/PvdO family nonheme iron enzyme [Polyangiaceae bacterium]
MVRSLTCTPISRISESLLNRSFLDYAGCVDDSGGSLTAGAEQTFPPALAEYRFIAPLGKGAMGRVFLAHDTLLDRPVAIKLLDVGDSNVEERSRLLTEARALARLSHPNVVTVHRAGESDGQVFLVTELVRGQTLAVLPKPLPADRVLSIARGICRGLSEAHRHNVLHRDIKPENVMYTDSGEVKILDFGLAKVAGKLGPTEGTLPTEDVRANRFSRGNQTVGEMVGTPVYMAPETFLGSAASVRSDIYSLGTVLYELCAGFAPRDKVNPNAPLHEWIHVSPPPLKSLAPEVDPSFVRAVDRCLAVESEDRFAGVEELLDALSPAPAPIQSTVEHSNPYRGLLPFQAEHRASFFGRTAEGEAVINRLRGNPLVIVTGDSGVGKSSLCRALILPMIQEGALGEQPGSVVGFVPGKEPLNALSTALSTFLNDSTSSILTALQTSPADVVRMVHKQLGSGKMVLFVDQLEEVYTLAEPDQINPFLEALAEFAAPSQRTGVLCTIRGDFFARLSSAPRLGEQLDRALYLLRPLGPQAMRLAIVKPLEQRGFAFESDTTVSTLVDAALRAPGGLPLLQFALSEMWELRNIEKHILPASALESIGGVAGALARHADGVLADLPMASQRAARRLLLRLVTPEGTRARRSAAELDLGDNGKVALEALISGRLVVARDGEGGTIVELSHEALLEGWSTLKQWVEAEGGQRLARRTVEAAASEWVKADRPRDALFGERKLAEVSSLDMELLSASEVEFLTTSKAAIRRDKVVRWATIAAVPAVLALIYGVVQWNAKRDLEVVIRGHRERAAAHISKGQAAVEKVKYSRQAAFEMFDRLGKGSADGLVSQLAEAEQTWAQTLDGFRTADGAFSSAGQSLEAAFVLDPTRADVRESLAEVTLQRAVLAGWFHETDLRAELVDRLEIYDVAGDKLRALTAKPSLTVSTEPAGAALSVHVYTNDHGAYRLAPLGEYSTKAPVVVNLPSAGSYLLQFEHPGQTRVRYPILIEAGESLHLTIPLPALDQVPEGFVYIPAGRFWVGSSDSEQLRKGLLNASPLHRVETGAYLISRTETTVGEYLEFLNSLGPVERSKRLPQGSAPSGRIVVREGKNGDWEYVWGHPDVEQVRREGELVHYGDRSTRADQNWRKLPVLAVSLDDARAYASWLSTSGKVKGARLCTEWEWERAARGGDGRIFPHGDTIQADDANFDETYGRKRAAFGPDEVGSHPASESPFGLFDMTGNGYEWVESLRPGEVIFRGGAWYYDRPSAWIANRTPGEVGTKDVTIGFRVCARASGG